MDWNQIWGGWVGFMGTAGGGATLTFLASLILLALNAKWDKSKREQDRNTYKRNVVLDKALEDHWKRIADYRELATKAEGFASKLPYAYGIRINSEMQYYIWYDHHGNPHDAEKEIEADNKRLSKEMLATKNNLDENIRVYLGESELATNQLTALSNAISQTMERYWAGIRGMNQDTFNASEIDDAVSALRARVREMEKTVPVE